MSSIATIADVAGHAGVSLATVSRALRNLPGVSEITREKVMDSARQLGYVMTPMAVARHGGPASRVAVVLPRADTWFFGRALGVLVERLAALGCVTEVHLVADPAARAAFFAAVGSTGRLGGVLVVGMSLTDRERSVLAGLPVPVVGLHSSLDSAASVEADDQRMARWAVEHLIGLGHRRIAMIASETGRPVPHAVPRARTLGYRAALAAAGLVARRDLEVCGADSSDGGWEASGRLLVGRHAPTAVFVHTDEMAFGVVGALAGAGLAVPGDVSVVSIDDHPLARALRLTTVAQDVEAQATRAADLLVHAAASRAAGRAAGRPVALVPRVEPPSRLIIRATTAPPSRPRRRHPRRPARAGDTP
jgi:LacI family transcriptional regulator, repressor for deo operon, udp, cdd, tsx, nupC, and nupG